MDDETMSMTIENERTTFATACAELRGKVAMLEATLVHNALEIADLLVVAKEAYEKETGTGHGRRNPSRVTPFVHAVAVAVGRSKPFVQRLLTLAKLDPATRAALSTRSDVSQTMLLTLAREADPERRAEAVVALETGGRDKFDEALARRAPTAIAPATAHRPSEKKLTQSPSAPIVTSPHSRQPDFWSWIRNQQRCFEQLHTFGYVPGCVVYDALGAIEAASSEDELREVLDLLLEQSGLTQRLRKLADEGVSRTAREAQAHLSSDEWIVPEDVASLEARAANDRRHPLRQ